MPLFQEVRARAREEQERRAVGSPNGGFGVRSAIVTCRELVRTSSRHVIIVTHTTNNDADLALEARHNHDRDYVWLLMRDRHHYLFPWGARQYWRIMRATLS